MHIVAATKSRIVHLYQTLPPFSDSFVALIGPCLPHFYIVELVHIVNTAKILLAGH